MGFPLLSVPFLFAVLLAWVVKYSPRVLLLISVAFYLTRERAECCDHDLPAAFVWVSPGFWGGPTTPPAHTMALLCRGFVPSQSTRILGPGLVPHCKGFW